MPVIETAVLVTSAVTGLVNSVNGIADTNKRRFYEQNLASLNIDQKAAIGKLLEKQTSEEGKMKVLSETLGTLNMARINSLTEVQKERDKTNRYIYISVIVGVFVLSGLGIYLYKRKKSK
jgi:hypothetical protein